MNLFPHGIKAAALVVCLLLSMLGRLASADPVPQDTVEAAMTLQILEFTIWPGDSKTEPSPSRTIGLIESDDTLATFQSLLLSKPQYAGRYQFVIVNEFTSAQTLRNCDAIFFNKPNPTEIPRIIRKTENSPTVLIGTFQGFLDQGGLVNISKKQKKLSFEIQLDNSESRNIRYRAKLLRLAKIVQE